MENKFDLFLEKIERRARKARIVSIVVSVLLVIMAAVFLYLTFKQISQAQTKLSQTKDELKQTEDKLQNANVELDKKRSEIDKLGTTITQIDQSKTSTPTASPTPPEAAPAPRIYLQVNDEAQMDGANRVVADLRKADKGYLVQGVQLVDVPWTWKNTEIRYFRPEDKDVAEEIAQILKQQSNIKDAEPKFVGIYKNVSPRQYEIWFSEQAFP